MSNSDTVLFVQGIPVDLDRKGLANLFTRAGPVKDVRVIPPKNSTYTSTFGFVEFANRTIAATALQMFNNYKIGTKYLSVSNAHQKTTLKDNAQSKNSVTSGTSHLSRISINQDLNKSNESDGRLSRKSSIGRGSLIHQNQPSIYKRGNFDLSRPFARKVLSRQSQKENIKDEFMDAEEPNTNIRPTEELKIGELYPVYITHVNTPSNFFVHLINAKEKTGNLINNMDNYYRNGLHHENADLDKILNIEIDDMCAGYLDSFWYRARVIDKWPDKRTYRLSIIDFGDVQELPYDHVTYLSQEFCETKPASIRCKLADIRPPKKSSEWSQKAQETMDTLYKQEDTLFAKIESIEEFEPSSGRFETIYGIDLIYGEESIISYFIQNGLAIQIENGMDNDECELNLYFKKNSAKQNTLNDQDTFESRTIDETIDEIMLNLSSVSLANINERSKYENVHVPKSLIESTNRTKLFNSLFRVFKKKDINPSIQVYKCSQVLDVKVVHIEDHLEFYVQPYNRLGDLEHLEICLNQYANALIGDLNLSQDLSTFQDKTNRFDLVLLCHEYQWKRAVFLERTCTSTLCSMFDHESFEDDEVSFFSFFLIDWGREVLIKKKLMHKNDLFILPYDQKLNRVGSFALKCKISEHQIKLREKIDSSQKMNQMRKNLFDKKFSEYFKDQILRMRISQIVNVKNEVTATVDLYFRPEQIENFLKIEAHQIRQLKPSNLNKSNVNCVQFVLDQIKQIELAENEFVPISNANFIKLTIGHRYKVNVQYYDESCDSPYFFVCLIENFDKLELLDGELQKISSDKTKFKYIEDITELKINDQLEALFEIDSKWYRVQVRSLEPLEIYFLDFGNSEIVVKLVPKTLRLRLKYDSEKESELFNLDYQAIKCRYESFNENRIKQFVEGLSKLESLEFGFELNVIDTDLNQVQECFLVNLDNKDKNDMLITTEVEENKSSIRLDIDSVIDGVSFVHIESINEFYVQTQDTLRFFIDFQAKIQRLLELMMANKSNQENQFVEIFNKGDFVFGKFLSDMNWYRAIIINKNKNNFQGQNKFDDLPNDGYLYDVYFLDYGNRQENLPSSLLFSFESVKELNKKLNLMAGKDLDYIIEMPYQALCCQLAEKKNNTRNNEILKSLVHECLNFSIKIVANRKQKLFDFIQIDRYSVYLSTDNKCLQDRFENETKLDKLNLVQLRANGVYECKLSNLDEHIYVNFLDEADEFLKLETQLINDDKIIQSKWLTNTEPNVGDLVLAKYVLDEKNSAWCRAIIINKTNLYDVFFIDYGNKSLQMSVNELVPLGADYSLTKYPAFAHKIQLYNTPQIDLKKHGNYLQEFLENEFKIKIIGLEEKDYFDICNCYTAEVWQKDMNKCLNSVLLMDNDDDSRENSSGETSCCSSDNIIKNTNLNELFLTNKLNELKVNVKYVFTDNLTKPFYFCLSTDFDTRSKLDTDMNQFYSKLNNIEENVQEQFNLNDYVAVYSEESWYRAQIKQLLDVNSILLFYIDYGFEELVEFDETNKQRLRKLDKKFFTFPKFVFGAVLVNPLGDKTDSYELITFEPQENQTLAKIIQEYFDQSNQQQFDLVILDKLTNISMNENFLSDQDYYAIEVYNDNNVCLNQMIVDFKENKEKKMPKPSTIRLCIDQMPKQKPLNDKYCVFARSLDHFYVYSEERVLQVQLKTQQTCAMILQEMLNFDYNHEEIIQVDDLVYAKYDDDETWYRCKVTNIDQKSSQVELFYLDFGNIEIMRTSDVLTGWNEQHLDAFMAFEPQAYKCQLYAFVHNEYTLEQKNMFKNFTSDKLFDVKFIKTNTNGTYEVSMHVVDKPQDNVHMFCFNQGIANFISFDQIIKLNRNDEENKFYINLLLNAF